MFVYAIALTYSVDSARAQNVDRWIHPGFGHNGSACAICGIDTYANDYEENYATTLRETDVFQFFINDIYNLGFYVYDPQQLRTRVGIYRKYGIRVSAEATGLNDILTDSNPAITYCQQSNVPKDPASVAHAAARQDLAKMQAIYDASGKLDYLALDNPIARVLQGPFGNALGCEFTLHDAIQALIMYMQDIHGGTGGYQGHPDIKIGMLIAFPNVTYQGIPPTQDPNIYNYNGIPYEDVLSQAVNDIRAAGETLWFLHADSPYNYVVNQAVDSQTYINRLVALQNQARSLNLRFGVIFNTAIDVNPSDYRISDQAYVDQTKEYIQRFQAAGGNPDDFVIESWFETPYYTYPENAQNSFMNLVLQVVPYWGYDHGHFRRLDSDIFNWREYLSFYPDVQGFVNSEFGNQQQFGAEWHWLNYGVFEGRDGSRPFFSQEYLAVSSNADVAQYYAGNWIAAIDHYFLYGRNEGRLPRSSMDCNNVYSGLNNVVGLNNGSGDSRFLCYEGRWYDSGWESNDPSWEFKAYNHQRVGHFECNLPYSRWDYVP